MTKANDFIPTIFSDENFEAIERAGKLTLSPELRTRVQQRVHKYERQVDYEASGQGERLLKEMAAQAANLRAFTTFARKLDEGLPGHLWSNIAADAGVSGACELDRLEDVCRAFERENATIAKARSVKTPDYKLNDLLVDLETIFKVATEGGKTGISNTNGKRGGRFVRFADAILGRLGQRRRLTTSVGARWQGIFEARQKGRQRPTRVWVGKAPPWFLKARTSS